MTKPYRWPQSIGVPILQWSGAVTGDGAVVFNLNGAFFSICPVEESYSGKFFSDTAITKKCFISQNIMDIIEVTDKSKAAAGDAGSTLYATDAFVGTNYMLQKRYKRNATRHLLSKKK